MGGDFGRIQRIWPCRNQKTSGTWHEYRPALPGNGIDGKSR